MKRPLFIGLWATLVVIGLALGTWQLERRAWKNAWLDQIEAAYQNPQLDNPLPLSTVDPTFFQRGQVTPTFQAGYYFFLTPKRHNNQWGGHLYQRARVNGQTLWILRGFVADGWERLPLIDGRAPVMLQIRAHDLDPSLVLQQNDHLTARDLADWPGLIGVVEPEASTPDNPAITAVGTRPSPNNNHLAYAIFWLVMSAVAAVFALLTMRQR